MMSSRRLPKHFLLSLALSLVVLNAFAQPQVVRKRPVTPPVALPDTRAVDLVIALDTSGSMEELLDSVRARVWDIVNEFARMQPTPELRVGLLSYGAVDSTAEDGWVLLHLDLTDDLDAVYGELMALRTAGSEEFVGRVLDTAVWKMDWSGAYDGLRVIFVAGNESADQGVEVADFRQVAKDAADKDILINVLYAGNREQGMAEKWPEVARHGRGNFSAIDTSLGSLQIATPQDEGLLALNASLNSTYLPYGERGQDGLVNQVAQDNNASRLGVQSCSSRIVAKGSALYHNGSWDLVDAVLQEDFELASLRVEDFPEAMQVMSGDQRLEYIHQKRAEREGIQEGIETLSLQREAHLKAVRAAQLQSIGLDDAMKEAIRLQAKAKGFVCDEC